MQSINVSPVEIIGKCPVELNVGDGFQIDGMRLFHSEQDKCCFLMLSQLPNAVWQLQSEQRFFAHVSCPGCTFSLHSENRVIFLLGHEDKWELCQLISQYLRLVRLRGENQSAVLLKLSAIQLEKENRFSEATELMRQAVDVISLS